MLKRVKRLNKLAQSAPAMLDNALQAFFNSDHFFQSDRCSFEVIGEKDLYSLRHYHSLNEKEIILDGKPVTVADIKHRVPLILVPPLGVHSWIFDLLVERSLVRFLLSQGYDVYLIDWGTPGREHTHISLEHYVLEWMPHAVASVREHSQQQEVSFMGYCMGGLLSLMYTATAEDQHVKNIVTVASPIDFRKFGPTSRLMTALERAPIASPLNRISSLTVRRIGHERFHLSGQVTSISFKLTNPMASVRSYVDFLANLADEEYVSRYTTVNRWFSQMVDYPGATMKSLVEQAGVKNALAKGEINVGDIKADLSKVKANLLAFAGENDKLVTIPSAKKIMGITQSEDKTFHVVPGGHAGIFAGRNAAQHTWAISSQWLADRSL